MFELTLITGVGLGKSNLNGAVLIIMLYIDFLCFRATLCSVFSQFVDLSSAVDKIPLKCNSVPVGQLF